MADLSQILSQVSRISVAFHELKDRQALISTILEAAIDLTSGDRGSIFLAPETEVLGRGMLTSLIATGTEGQEIKVSLDKGVVGHVFKTGQPEIINNAQKDKRFFSGVDTVTQYKTETLVCAPLKTLDGQTFGVIEILNSKNGKFDKKDLQVLQILAHYAAIALEHRQTVTSLQETRESLQEARKKVLSHAEDYPLETANADLREVYEKLSAFAMSDSSILIEGESGTGKEAIAHLIHSKSARKNKSFIAINCAAIPESLFEAELFGVAKGAATGTVARKGKVELADGGTLFLDEIGELPLTMQAKLLRVLQEKSVSRVGSEDQPYSVDFRLIAATNQDLGNNVRLGKFRDDLYYRVNVVRLRVPPLRERLQDLPKICEVILKRFQEERGWKPKIVSPSAMSSLMKYTWPGNVRELQNKLEAAVIRSGVRPSLTAEDFQFDPSAISTSKKGPTAVALPAAPNVDISLKSAKKKMLADAIQQALLSTGGNKVQAAKLLGISREGLRLALKRIGSV